MEIIWVLVIIWAVWYFTKKHNQKNVGTLVEADEEKPRNFTEEEVLAFQTKFEKRLEEQIDFPDGIRFTPIYIYKNMMRKWYSELAGKYRYDDQMIQKLRNDWVNYMYLLERSATASYLWFETEGERAEEHHQDAMNYSRKIFAIEDAFASYLGEDKVKELVKVRAYGHGKINKQGELAPEGKRFTSLGDLLDDKGEDED
jgi:hypothetical protein